MAARDIDAERDAKAATPMARDAKAATPMARDAHAERDAKAATMAALADGGAS